MEYQFANVERTLKDLLRASSITSKIAQNSLSSHSIVLVQAYALTILALLGTSQLGKGKEQVETLKLLGPIALAWQSLYPITEGRQAELDQILVLIVSGQDPEDQVNGLTELSDLAYVAREFVAHVVADSDALGGGQTLQWLKTNQATLLQIFGQFSWNLPYYS